jgi:hypothetical protein
MTDKISKIPFVMETTVFNTIVGGQKQPTELPNPREIGSNPWSEWGGNNIYPQEVMAKIAQVSLVSAILDWKARALYGGGLEYGCTTIDAKGKESFIRVFDKEIEEWLTATDIMLYLMEASSYFYHFYNIFPEMVMSKDGKRIVFLTCLESTDVRYKRREKEGINRGLITKAYVSPDWKQVTGKADLEEIEVINTQRDPLGTARGWKNKKFIYPVAYPSPGRGYYQAAPWHALLDTWLPVAKGVPAFKQSLLTNQMAIKYLMHVPEYFWEWKHPGFNVMADADRRKIMKEEYKQFNDFLSGEENAGKSLVMTIKDNKAGIEYKDWKIDAIDDKMKNGMYLEDSQEADAHIFKNLNVDPTLFGAGVGKNASGGGSGSDKRVAWNNYIIMTKPHQDIILKPLHFIAKFNGWAEKFEAKYPNSKFEFHFKNYRIAKLDSGNETEDADINKDEPGA